MSNEKLTDTETRVLDFERKYPHQKNTGYKTSKILEELGMSEPRYYQILNCAIEKQEALEKYPDFVPRLLRIRDVRQQRRDQLAANNDA